MRKNILVLALIFCGGFYLAAQSGPEASIFIPAITGKGRIPEDNAFFYKQLVFEIASENFNLAKTQRSSDYSLVGTIGPYRGYINEPPYEGQFAFHLELRNNKTGEMNVEGEFLYTDRENAKEQLPLLVSTLLYTIPVDGFYADTNQSRTTTDEDVDWRDKFLYLGLAGTWTPRFYIGDVGKNAGDDSAWYPGNPHFALSAEFHCLEKLSLETAFEMSADYLISGKVEYRNTIIELPFLIKYVIKSNSSFMFEPYVGAHFNFPIYNDSKTTQPSKLSFLLGFQYAIKAGPGAVFVDARFAADVTNSIAKPPEGIPGVPKYHRYIIHLGLGYKYGFSRRSIK